jgi:2-oxoglutarate dehydrogenase E1 component
VAGRFREVVDDAGAGDPSRVTRVILASGKVAYDAIAHRDEHRLPAAVVRVEQLYPWPEMLVLDTVSRYRSAREVVWLQEEPENMGAWTFVHGRLHRLLRDAYTLRHVSRPESASPATGSQTVHQKEQADLLTRTFAGL